MRTDEMLKVQEAHDALRDENEKLRAALKPFADYADPRNGVPPSFQITVGSSMARKQLGTGRNRPLAE